jgi:hypothetical protein
MLMVYSIRPYGSSERGGGSGCNTRDSGWLATATAQQQLPDSIEQCRTISNEAHIETIWPMSGGARWSEAEPRLFIGMLRDLLREDALSYGHCHESRSDRGARAGG